MRNSKLLQLTEDELKIATKALWMLEDNCDSRSYTSKWYKDSMKLLNKLREHLWSY